MEIRNNIEKKNNYVRKPLNFSVPIMEDKQFRMNPFKKPSRRATFNKDETGTLAENHNLNNAKLRSLTVLDKKKPPMVHPDFATIQKHITVISEISESITEDQCEWIFEDILHTESEVNNEEFKESEEIKYELTKEILHNFNNMKSINSATLDEIRIREVTLKSSIKKSDKTLILDLDDTLVHTINPFFDYASINVFQTHAQSVIYNHDDESVFNNIKVIIRPYAIKLLEELSQLYEIIVI